MGSAAYAAAVLRDSPVGYWRLDEVTGTTAADLTAGARTGTYTGGVVLNQPGVAGTSVQFDGIDDQVVTATCPISTNTNVTLECWAYIGPGNHKGYFVKVGEPVAGTAGFGIGIGSTSMDAVGTNLIAVYDHIRWLPSIVPMSLGWHHVAMVVNASGYPSLYLDGVLAYTDTTGAPNAPSATTGKVYIGGYTEVGPNARYFDGRVDEVAIYNAALTPAQLTAHITARLGNYRAEVMLDAPLGYWRLEETAGTTATDSSGNARNGTYTGTGVTYNRPGVVGAGITLDGSTGWVDLGDVAAFQLSPAVTVEAWHKPSAASATAGVFDKTIGGVTNKSYALFQDGTSWTWRVCFGGALYNATGGTPAVGAWTHLVGTADGANIRLYVNGALVTTTAMPVAVTAGAGVAYIGTLGSSVYRNAGSIDEVSLYPSALSAARIAAHYYAAAPSYRALVLSDAPLAYWRLGETSGTSAVDASGNSRTGTYTGGVTLNQPGALLGSADANPSALFDGLANYVDVAHNAVFDLTGDLSLEAWVYPLNRLNYRMVVTKCITSGSTGNTFELRLENTTGIPTFLQYTGSLQSVAATTAPPVGSWSHLVVTKTGTTVAHYLNGVANGTGTLSGTVSTNTQPVRVGTRDDTVLGTSNYWFYGRLDEAAIYNTALPPSHIQAHYLAGSKYAEEVLADGPLGYWKLDDTSGTVCNDYSGNARTGTYTGTGVTYNQPAVVGAGITLDGSTGYVTISSNAAFDFSGNAPFSLEAWIKPSVIDGAYRRIIDRESTVGGRQGWSLGLQSGIGLFVSRMLNGTEQRVDAAASYLTVGVWQHVAATYDGTTLRSYINGVARGSGASTQSITGTTVPLSIGTAPNYPGNNSTGGVDEVAVYNIALSAERVAAHYTAGRIYGALKRWTGTAWEPLLAQRWDGTQWVPFQPKRWDGTAWV